MSLSTGTIEIGDEVRCPGGTAQGHKRPDLNDQIGKATNVNGRTRRVEVEWPRGRVYYDGKACYDDKRQPILAPERVWHEADEIEVVS